MTAHNSLKRRIRSRMNQSGESFSTARKVVLRHERRSTDQPAERLTIVLAQPETRTGVLARDLEDLFEGEVVPSCDVLVLPELIGGNDATEYELTIGRLARRYHCYVVGGSCYAPRGQMLMNAGVVANTEGNVISRYEKTRPYGSEINTGIARGSKIGRFEVAGRSISVMICSDIWFSETLTSLGYDPDALLIPSFSITQRDSPRKPRALWKHMLVARAYEYAAYVGVCDWAHPCQFDGLCAAGVSGFANPRPSGECFYAGNESRKLRAYELDFGRLDAFRHNRATRGFLSSNLVSM